MEGYPQDPYAAYAAAGGAGGGFDKKFHNVEGILPVVLLIVIGIFVLQVLGVTGCLIPIGCGGEINVAVIGQPSPGVQNILQSKQAVYRGIKFNKDLHQDYITPEILKKYDIVVLQGQPYFDMNAREAIRSYVDGGGKMILIGDAATRAPESPNVYGWEWPAGRGVPSPVEPKGKFTGFEQFPTGSEVRIIDIDHPITKGLKVVNSRLSMPAPIFEIVPNNIPLAVVETYSYGGVERSLPAIVEGGSGLGKIIYFAYDPGLTPEMFLSSLIYLAG